MCLRNDSISPRNKVPERCMFGNQTTSSVRNHKYLRIRWKTANGLNYFEEWMDGVFPRKDIGRHLTKWKGFELGPSRDRNKTFFGPPMQSPKHFCRSKVKSLCVVMNDFVGLQGMLVGRCLMKSSDLTAQNMFSEGQRLRSTKSDHPHCQTAYISAILEFQFPHVTHYL